MPKKFATENTKATAAKARKAAVKEVEEARKKQAMEDALWQEDDKHILKKQQRKEENLKKKEEQQRKKAELKALLESEAVAVKGKTPPTKVTRSQIQSDQEKKKEGSSGPKLETHLTTPLEENINRIEIEGDEARSVTEAIAILSVSEPAEDKHPERRMKAAFAAFEERNMPRIKEENPTLRLSQLKQILKKEWMKSPENPFNQIAAQR
uniref:Coiled-coil domain-containing protein n=1 Tax=Riptortus pedestris TaxID=329032 RepID=R4WNV7_RIPPE|nr:conserved hypothetical protein [Riptortus pedestris]